ncbi:putative ribonuclease Oy [Trichinella spiralis]|uniref:putative ribonuclease Oy n=1 Tax=Trichinella spiralis TaxID=6334 RepID=UPI0001EFCB0A|nr:putative ribonuclease Oy [Trichinella spiralis]
MICYYVEISGSPPIVSNKFLAANISLLWRDVGLLRFHASLATRPSFSKSQHASPAFCYNETGFHVNDLQQIIPSLNTFWPNLRHEWLKHGTCAFGTLDSTSAFKYFQLGIQLKLLYSVDL